MKRSKQTISSLVAAILLLLFSIGKMEAQVENAYAGLATPPQNASIWEYKASTVSTIPEFWEITDQSKAPTVEQFIPWLKHTFKVDANIDFYLVSTDTDNEGWSRYRYGQKFHGIMLDGPLYIINVRNKKVVFMNGQAVDHLNLPFKTAISIETARQAALNYMRNHYLRATSNAQYAPVVDGTPELVYNFISNAFNGPVALTYRIPVRVDEVPLFNHIYVHAITGNVVNDINQLQAADTAGGGNSKYSGNVNLTVYKARHDSFVLRDSGRFCITLNLRNRLVGSIGSATPFTSTHARFSYNGVRDTDRYAFDMQFAAEKWYDYFRSRYGRSGIDNANYTVRSYIHYGNAIANGYWDGTRVLIGDGAASVAAADCGGTRVANKPYTELDFAAHEITHGLTSNTSMLVYSGESGALNEGFSDIFGETVQAYAMPAQLDWIFAPHTSSNIPDRRFNNPQGNCDPSTYLKNNWRRGTTDNGGVHHNSLILSYWYYLLSVGKNTGSNDNGDLINVPRIGIDSASYVAYYTLIGLPRLAKYNDARYLSLQIARIRKGVCSRTLQSVLAAWDAVGVYGVNPIVVGDHARPSMFKGDTTVLNVATTQAGFSYTWAPSARLTSPRGAQVKAFPTATTTYTVTATCGGARYKDSLTVVILPKLFKDSINKDTMCFGDTAIAQVILDSARLRDSIPYVRNLIAYNPATWATNDIGLVGDDERSSGIAFGFNFPFYKDSFSSVYMTTNGYAGFNLPAGSVVSGTIPNAAAPNNIIALAWRDLNTKVKYTNSNGDYDVDYQNDTANYDYSFNGVYSSATLGNPSRLILQMNAACNYDQPHNSVTGQIVMYKSGDIDPIIFTADNATQTQGIENADGTKGLVSPGRNNAAWSAFHSAYRFSPTTSKKLRYKWRVLNYHCYPTAGILTPDSAKTKYAPAPCDAPYKYNKIKLVCEIYDSVFKWTKYDTVKIVVIHPVATILGTFNGCPGDTLPLKADTTACIFKWYNGSTLPNIKVVVRDTNFKVWLIGRCWHCADTDTVVIQSNPKPIMTVTGKDSICSGSSDTIRLVNAHATWIRWNPGALTDSTIIVSPTATTVYKVYARRNKCSDSATFNVKVDVSPKVYTNGNKNICAGKSVVLSVTGNATFVWMPGNIAGPNDTVSPSTTTTYTVNVTTNNACPDFMDTVRVDVRQNTTSARTATICDNQKYSMFGKNYTVAGIYHDTIPNKRGCDSVVTLTLTVNKTYVTDVYDSACTNAYLSYNGVNYACGNYLIKKKTVAGCDSIINLHIKCLYRSSSEIKASYCRGTVVTIGGIAYSSSGVYYQYYKNKSGCDSTLTICLYFGGCKDGLNPDNSLNANGQIPVIYPNPANGSFTVDLNTISTESAAQLEIIDILGRTLYSNKFALHLGLLHADVSNVNQASGIYFVRILIGSDTYIARLVIQH